MLRDGVLQIKRKWSQRLTDTANYGCALRVLAGTPAVRAFLCNNPFVFKRDGRLFGAVFVDGDKPLTADDIRQLDKDYFHPGLARLRIYVLGQEHLPVPSPVPAELAEHIELFGNNNLPAACSAAASAMPAGQAAESGPAPATEPLAPAIAREVDVSAAAPSEIETERSSSDAPISVARQ